jgi:hypothetical protein
MNSERVCTTCAHFGKHYIESAECGLSGCFAAKGYPNWTAPTDSRAVSLPEDPKLRAEYPIFDGFLAYFPNATAEVARLSYKATQQHHPEAGMHWDRSKSTDHLNKIGRHIIDAGKLDDNGLRHSVMLAWRAMANLQEELEREQGLPPSPAPRNRPY